MPSPTFPAARRRDQRLVRTRRATLWVAGGAAAASLGLGTAFAHALPGHQATSAGSRSSAATAGTQPQGTPAQGTQPRHGAKANRSKPQSPPLSQPTTPPSTAPASPQAVSGGS